MQRSIKTQDGSVSSRPSAHGSLSRRFSIPWCALSWRRVALLASNRATGRFFPLTCVAAFFIFNHMVKYISHALDKVFAALAHPTRRALLERLAQGDTSVSDLATPFAMSLPAISKHLRVLEQAGLIARTKDGRVHRLRLRAQPMRDAAAWLAYYQQFWDTRLDALDHYLHHVDPTDEQKEQTS